MNVNPFQSKTVKALIGILFLCLVCSLSSFSTFLYVHLKQGQIDVPLRLRMGDDIKTCLRERESLLTQKPIDNAASLQIYSLCYDVDRAQMLVEEEGIRRDNFVYQRSENTALLTMVICITVSGVVLAGLQLLASFKLATIRPLVTSTKGASNEPDPQSDAKEEKYGKTLLAKEPAQWMDVGTFELKANAVVVRSSVVGVLILAISFAFFMVFVVYVYELHDVGSMTEQSSLDTPAVATNTTTHPWNFNLTSVPTKVVKAQGAEK